MANPVSNDVNYNPLLTNISTAFMQGDDTFIAPRVFPRVPVELQSAAYYQYRKEDWFRSIADVRAPGAESVGNGWNLSTDTYYAHVYAVHKDIDDQTVANAISMFDLKQDATMWVTKQLLLKAELVWQNAFFKTSVWSKDVAGVASGVAGTSVTYWDTSTSNPIDDIEYYALKMAEGTGLKPNKLILSPYVFQKLSNHPTILDRIKYTQRGVVTKELMASLFGVDTIEIPYAIYNTVLQGTTDALANYSFIFGKHALLVHAASAPSLMTPTAGYSFIWSGYTGNANQNFGNQVSSWYRQDNKSERVEGEMAMGFKVVGADLGVFFSSVVQ